MEKETWEERQERERKQNEAFQDKMGKVAMLKDSIWTWNNLNRDNKPMADNGYLIGVNGAKIWVKNDTWKTTGRINITSLYPNCYPVPTGKSITISVSPSKTPEQIARDINNRFLPFYLPELAEHNKRIKEHQNYEANKKAMMEHIATYLGEKIHDNGNIYTKIKEVYYIEPYGEDKVKFTVQCSAEKATKVFMALSDNNVVISK